MKLEVVPIRASDVDRAKMFCEKLSRRFEIVIANGDFRAVPVTPYKSEASILFGKGIGNTNEQ